jgi:GNAT superfamily N-acetyltransferase
MAEITYKSITDGNIEICRDLCDALMAYQAEKGVIHPEVLRAMNFDNRLKPGFEGAAEKQLIVALDGGKPVGYPDWLEMPAKIGCLSNLYVLPEYRGRGIAMNLCDRAMAWLRNVPDIRYIYVYVSNGNDGVVDFYKKFGFEYSHDVFGGFIIAYYQEL